MRFERPFVLSLSLLLASALVPPGLALGAGGGGGSGGAGGGATGGGTSASGGAAASGGAGGNAVAAKYCVANSGCDDICDAMLADCGELDIWVDAYDKNLLSCDPMLMSCVEKCFPTGVSCNAMYGLAYNTDTALIDCVGECRFPTIADGVGVPASSGVGPGSGSGAGGAPGAADDDGDCSCSAPGRSQSRGGWWMAAAVALMIGRRRR